jgi:hypothetical protein
MTSATNHSTETQRQRILAALIAHGRLSTLQARHDLDVLHPAARIMELRKQGHRIAMIWKQDDTGQASRHRVGCYVYQGGDHG